MKNFTNNPLLSIIILLLLTANIVTLAFLWTNRPGDKREKGMPPLAGGQVFEFVSNELKLDSAQRAAYGRLRDGHQAAQRPLRDSIRKAKDDFFSLLQQANAPDSLIQAGSKRTTDAEQQLELLTFRHFQQLRAICNADQQKKFDEIIQDVLRRMGPGRQGQKPGGRQGEGPGGREHMPPPNGEEGQPG